MGISYARLFLHFLVMVLGITSSQTPAYAILPAWVCRAAGEGAEKMAQSLAYAAKTERANAHHQLTQIFLTSKEGSERAIAAGYLGTHFKDYHFLILDKSGVSELETHLNKLATDPAVPRYWTVSRKLIALSAGLIVLSLGMEAVSPDLASLLSDARSVTLGLTGLALGSKIYLEFRDWLAQNRVLALYRLPGFSRFYFTSQFPRRREPEGAGDFFKRKIIIPLEDRDPADAMVQVGKIYAFHLWGKTMVAIPKVKKTIVVP